MKKPTAPPKYPFARPRLSNIPEGEITEVRPGIYVYRPVTSPKTVIDLAQKAASAEKERQARLHLPNTD